VARAFGQKMAEDWNQQVIVENKGGSAHVTGLTSVARAAPDGHTLMVAEAGAFAINPLIFPKGRLPYDEKADFAPITGLVRINQALLASKSLPVNNAAELIALAKQKPGALNFGTAGIGSALHMNIELFKTMAGVNLTPVHSIATLATSPGEIDDIYLATAITRHPTGVAILAAPQAIEEAELVTEHEIGKALPLMRSRFGFTIVDTPRTITTPVVAALEHSDRVFVLTDLSVPSVRAARRTFELLGHLEGALEHPELLITELGPLDVKKAVQVIGKEPFAVIPRDESASSAMNDGVPLNGRPTRLAVALDELARRIAGVQAGGAKTPRGLFGRIFPKGARP